MRNSEESSEWRSRPSKKEKIIECFCGKSYRVQSAFRMHVQVNHEGMSVEQARVHEKMSKGRPRQISSFDCSSDEEVLENPLECLREVKEKLEIDPNTIKQLYENQQVFKFITPFLIDKQPPDLKYIEEDKINQVKLGVSLAMLIKELRSIITDQKILEECLLMLTLYVSTIIEQTQDQNVLKQGTASLFPEFINAFILFDLKNKISKVKMEQLWIFKMKNLLVLFNQIFQWFKFKKFIKGKIELNSKFKQELDSLDQTKEVKL